MAAPLRQAIVAPIITASELAGRIREQAAPRIVDVREPNEFQAGHIPSAENIPLSRFLTDSGRLKKDEEIALVCRSGNRSGMAQQFLRLKGFTRTRNLIDGMLGWNGPIV